MFIDRFFRVTSAAGLAAVLLAGSAAAGTRHYDITPLLNEPHPFAAGAPRAPAAAAPVPAAPTAPAQKTYEQRVNAWVANRGSTLGRLAGVAPPRSAVKPKPIWSEPEAPRRIRPDDHRIQFALGYFDVTDNDDAAEFRVEWQGKKLLWIVRPLAGMMGTSDGAFYTFAGIAWDIFFGKRFVLTTSFAPGLYVQNDGKKLGSPVEFRSMGEIAYRFDNGSRLGLSLYHLSNAGLTQFNPGVEVVSMNYTVPFGVLFR